MHQEFYITRFSFLKLFENLSKGFKIDGELFYKPLKFYFEEWHVYRLLIIKYFLSNPFEVYQYFEYLKDADNYSRLIPPTLPAFHSSINCDRLHNSYENVHLPAPLKGNPNEVEAFRKIVCDVLNVDSIHKITIHDFFGAFEEIKYEMLRNKKLVKLYSDSGFKINDILVDDFVKIRRNNSGESVISIEEQIIQLHKEFVTRYKLSGKSKGYKRENAYELEALNIFRNEYENIFFTLLVDHYIKEYNSELLFPEIILKELGFVPCKSCNSEIINKPGDIKNGNDETTEETEIHDYLNFMAQKFDVIELIELGQPLNVFEEPLENIEDIKNAGKGLYYCLHKFSRQLQFVYKFEKGWTYCSIPMRKNNKPFHTTIFIIAMGKRKSLNKVIQSDEKYQLIVMPYAETAI